MRLPLTTILRAARHKIESNGLAKGGWAFNRKGKPVPYRSPKAHQYDLLGAVFRSAWEIGSDQKWAPAILTLAEDWAVAHIKILVPMARCEWHIADWNDARERTADDVVSVLERACVMAHNSPFEET